MQCLSLLLLLLLLDTNSVNLLIVDYRLLDATLHNLRQYVTVDHGHLRDYVGLYYHPIKQQLVLKPRYPLKPRAASVKLEGYRLNRGAFKPEVCGELITRIGSWS